MRRREVLGLIHEYKIDNLQSGIEQDPPD